MKRLILHADDFGLNKAVTRGIVKGLSSGLLTGTSVLSNAPAARLAIDLWKQLEPLRAAGELPSTTVRDQLGDADLPFDLGVHLNLTQGRPLTGARYPDELLDADGRFLAPGRLFFKLAAGGRWRWALSQELSVQIEWLFDHGLRPTHLNGHQYIEMMPVVCDLIPELARRYGISSVRVACEPGYWRTSLRPGLRLANCGLSSIKHHYAVRFCRILDAAGIRHPGAYFGASHAGRVDLPLVRRFLRFARSHAVSEIAFHPGELPSLAEEVLESLQTDGWPDPLAAARPRELRLLTSPELSELLLTGGFHLARFNRSATVRALAV
jgi:predicted glycoside hydrolase/deacetylase ChbG (UPF0249 family)